MRSFAASLGTILVCCYLFHPTLGDPLPHRCLICNSTETGCEEAGAQFVGNCTLESDSCFTSVANGVLLRGCFSQLSSEEERQQCALVEGVGACIACTGNECNHHSWHKCLQCDDADVDAACTDGVQYARFCPLYRSGDRCYEIIHHAINDQSQSERTRGCESTLQSAGFACNQSEGCSILAGGDDSWRIQTALETATKCLVCSSDGSEGDVCAKGTSEGQECPQPTDQCFSRLQDRHLERGCLSTLDGGEQVKCSDPADATCVTCQGPSCNTGRWLNCAKCTTLTNPACSGTASSGLEELSSYCTSHNSLGKCYSRVIQDNIERGCTLELDDTGLVCQGSAGCAICALDNCNTHTKESLLSGIKCVKCSSSDAGSNCNGELPDPESCPGENDRCFGRVTDGTLTRNCLSLLDESDQVTCSNPDDRSCIVCEETGCNSDHWIMCHQCDTSTQSTCTDEQPDAASTYCKAYNADDKCYTKFANDLLTRGCLSDAAPGVDVCAGAVVCQTCEGDACNKASEATLVHTKCQQCTSAESSECALGMVDSTVCPREEDLCYTAVNSEMVLSRGCLSTLSETLQQACQDETNPSCVSCVESGCNRLQWPHCYRCQSSADESCDRSLTDEQLRFCRSYSERTFCYSSIVNDVVIRDCATDANSVCKHNNRCVACDGEGCNSVPREILEDVHTCYKCSSNKGACDLLEGPGQECKQHNDRCYTKLTAGTLTRGCLSDINEEDECVDTANCIACDGKDCNKLPWPKCYQCSNETAGVSCSSAQKDAEALVYCQHYTDRAECFAMIDNTLFTRGCTSDLEDPNRCDEPKTCVTCTGAACNVRSAKSYFKPASCLRCHSDLKAGCLEGTVEPAACADPDDVCFFRRTSARSVHRGCLLDLSPADRDRCTNPYGRSCHTCEEEGCNSAGWRACFQCSNFTQAGCELQQLEETHLKLCELFDDDCFEDRTDLEVRRGCGRSYCESRKTCIECDQDGCNGHSADDLMPTRCLVCDSTDPFCVNGSRFDQYCEYLDEPCYSLVGSDGVLQYGCLAQLTEPHKSKCLNATVHSCISCNGNSCNRLAWRLCIQCRSVELENYCSREATPLKSRYCMRYQRDDRCYVKDINGIVTRGCESDYDPPAEVCEGLNKRNCFLCEGDNCNDMSLNGAGRLLQQSSTVYSTSLVLIQCLLGFFKLF